MTTSAAPPATVMLAGPEADWIATMIPPTIMARKMVTPPTNDLGRRGLGGAVTAAPYPDGW
ncbi:hypothetical protein GCM10009525_35610 [Streptosporangium amethystogenes subsp. fukuiense]